MPKTTTKRKHAAENISEPLILPKRLSQRKPMQALSMYTAATSAPDTNTTILATKKEGGRGGRRMEVTAASGNDRDVAKKVTDENLNYAKAATSNSENKNKQCNMCKSKENNCVDLSSNHSTVLNFSEIVRLPSWNIRQILTSICSRCLVYIGALTESCKNIRQRCEKALQDQNLPSIAPPTPDTSSSDLLQISIPSPADRFVSSSPVNGGNLLLTTQPLLAVHSQQNNTIQISNDTSNITNVDNSMLEIHHERSLSPLNTESGGAKDKESYQRLPTEQIEMKCKYCSREYKLKRYFNKHVRRCGLIARSSKSLNVLPNGVISNIQPPRNFHCNVCPIIVDSIKKLWQHKRKHYKRFNCKICAKEFTTAVDYDFHRAECTSQLEARNEIVDKNKSAQQMPARRKTRSYSRSCSVFACASTTSSSNGRKSEEIDTPTDKENPNNKTKSLPASKPKTNSIESKEISQTEPDKEDALSTISNYVQRHKELYTTPDQYCGNEPTTLGHNGAIKIFQNCDDALSTITNYVQRHKELYTLSEQYCEENSYEYTSSSNISPRQGQNYGDIQSSINRHKELYRKFSTDASCLNYGPYAVDGDDDDDDDETNDDYISLADSSYTHRLTLINEWIEIHSSPSSHKSQHDNFPSHIDVPCKTLKEYDLYLLQRLKREVKQKSITCTENNCGFAAFSLNDMMLHDYIDHYKIPRFYCRKCGHWFTSKIFLDYHLDIQDNGHYVCYKCGYEFSRQSQLDLHLLQHNQQSDSIRKAKCLYCDLEFLNREQLVEHCTIEQHSSRRKRKLIQIERSMTIKNKVRRRRRSTYRTKYRVKDINIPSQPISSKRCKPMEKYQITIPHRIGKVEFDNPWKPNCVAFN